MSAEKEKKVDIKLNLFKNGINTELDNPKNICIPFELQVVPSVLFA